MITSLKRNGCGYEFETYLYQVDDKTITYRVRHAGTAIEHTSKSKFIDNVVEVLMNRILDTIMEDDDD